MTPIPRAGKVIALENGQKISDVVITTTGSNLNEGLYTPDFKKELIRQRALRIKRIRKARLEREAKIFNPKLLLIGV